MRKFFIAVCSLLIAVCALPAYAELKVDIIAGNTEPVAIALQKFEVAKGTTTMNADAETMRTIVENDLKSSGLFRIVSHDAFPEFAKFDATPKFADWSVIKTAALVQTKLEPIGDKYKLSFYLWDVAGKEQIEAQTLVATKKTMRRISHIMADAIYERLTGEIGYFDTQIIFIAQSGTADKPIKRMAIMDSDGGGFRYLSSGRDMVMSPHFSPNMQTVVFLSFRDNAPTVWALDMNDGTSHRLGKFGDMTFSPRYSPDGSRVALSLVDGLATNIYEYDMNARTLRQLTYCSGICTSPSYSPDGAYLAYNSDESGRQQINVLDTKTLKSNRISFGAGRYAMPAWSPDGNYIAFTKISDDTFYIGIFSPTGKNEKILASGWYMDSASWAPNSRRVVYYQTDKDKDDDKVRHSTIRSVDITGMNDYEITIPSDVNGTEPTWSPRLP